MSSSNQLIPSLGPVATLPPVELELAASRHHFGRWPLVPSRELKHIRQILLHASSVGATEESSDLSDSARDLLELVTTELQRRGQTNVSIGSPENPTDRAKTPVPSGKRGVSAHARAI